MATPPVDAYRQSKWYSDKLQPFAMSNRTVKVA
jgi:hypothetical protein